MKILQILLQPCDGMIAWQAETFTDDSLNSIFSLILKLRARCILLLHRLHILLHNSKVIFNKLGDCWYVVMQVEVFPWILQGWLSWKVRWKNRTSKMRWLDHRYASPFEGDSMLQNIIINTCYEGICIIVWLPSCLVVDERSMAVHNQQEKILFLLNNH